MLTPGGQAFLSVLSGVTSGRLSRMLAKSHQTALWTDPTMTATMAPVTFSELTGLSSRRTDGNAKIVCWSLLKARQGTQPIGLRWPE